MASKESGKKQNTDCNEDGVTRGERIVGFSQPMFGAPITDFITGKDDDLILNLAIESVKLLR
ncbi:hypothetical protein VB10N_40140 [Vibrio sp. 10N]|nr:hypothetical protein VB10N_40140 [Vibrio sp. 10N]